MTIIVYRDGIMAADTASFANGIEQTYVKKIIRTEDGGLFAACGTSVDCYRVGQWAQRGFPEDKPSLVSAEDGDFGALFVNKQGDIFKIQTNLIPFPVFGPFHADGAHLEMAVGAMAAGATAAEAAAICIRLGQYCGGEVQIEHLHQAPKQIPPDLDDLIELDVYPDGHALLHAYAEALDRCYDGVVCIASARSPTGEPFVSIGESSDGDCAYPGTVDQGMPRILASSDVKAVEQFARMFTAYAADRTGRLYWRTRPAIERDESSRKVCVFARCLISDKPDFQVAV